jgi:hypothetical protein
MFHYPDSPPQLHHSPTTHDYSSRDSTPVTPVDFDSASAKGKDKERESRLPWFRKPIDVGKPTSSLTTLLQHDFDESSFPLFGGMASPIEIRQASTSPRAQQSSNLTSALRKSPDGGSGAHKAGHIDAVTNGNRYDANHNHRPSSKLEHGAVPIFPGDKPRRESIAAQSLGTGMSWGGVSVGSWIRDE